MPNRVTIEVRGLNAAELQRLSRSGWKQQDWQRLLAVYAHQTASVGDVPPMHGEYRTERDVLRFVPQFPLEPEVTYRAVFWPERLTNLKARAAHQPLTAEFQAQARAASRPTEVILVYPTAKVLPENLLKFYVRFSAPINRGRVYEHIALRHSSGRNVELPFLEIGEELWDPSMTRLTLLFDPGRIKRGVRPLDEVGPSLEDGQSYVLVISRGLQDSHGKSLKADFEKAFRVGPADRDPPDPSRWQIETPPSRTKQPLQVTFAEPMDNALALRLILVVSNSGRILRGIPTLDDEERRWSFVPTSEWAKGDYNLVVQTTIEDLSGNNVGKPFDVDLFEGIQKRLTAESVKIPFQIR